MRKTRYQSFGVSCNSLTDQISRIVQKYKFILELTLKKNLQQPPPASVNYFWAASKSNSIYNSLRNEITGSWYWYSSVWITITSSRMELRTREEHWVVPALEVAAALRDGMAAAAARYRRTKGHKVWMVLKHERERMSREEGCVFVVELHEEWPVGQSCVRV